MKRFDQLVQEMAEATEDIRAKVYYHGTVKPDVASKILANGIQPPSIEIMKHRKGFQKPVLGKVYLTPSLYYALIYAMGGIFYGYETPASMLEDTTDGFLFEIPGSELKDIQPDEDSIGEFLYNNSIPWLEDMARRYVAPSRLRKVKNGYAVYHASVGKQLVSKMSDSQKLDLIRRGAHIAHTGPVWPSKAWRIDRERTQELSKDHPEDFEKISERIL